MRIPVRDRFTICVVALVASLSPLALASDTQVAGNCVVLLHGLARTSASMEKMADALTNAGYRVVNDSYPSRKYPIEELAPMAIEPALKKCASGDPSATVHFVTHSLGGILVRYYFADREPETLGRVVMLAPPNQGSAAADALRNVPGFELLNGPAGRQLGKGDDSVPLHLEPPDFEFAVIAGNRSIDPISSAVLPNPDDGKVSVDDTKLEGMSDFALVTVSHAYIMQDEEVIELVIEFLENGRFGES